jgi:hypothetical protein
MKLQILIGVVAVVASAEAHAALYVESGGKYVWTELGQNSNPPPPRYGINPIAMGGINPAVDLAGYFQAGDQLRITRIAIGGDADITSGVARFALESVPASIGFSWLAGQTSTISRVPATTYNLGFTTGNGDAKNFVYGSLNVLLPIDAGFAVTWTHQLDFDGRYLQGTDIHGNSFSDPANSVRPWVEFEIVSNDANIVPEPSGTVVLGMALLGFMLRLRAKA